MNSPTSKFEKSIDETESDFLLSFLTRTLEGWPIRDLLLAGLLMFVTISSGLGAGELSSSANSGELHGVNGSSFAVAVIGSAFKTLSRSVALIVWSCDSVVFPFCFFLLGWYL